MLNEVAADLHEYAAEEELSDSEALQSGMQEKPKEFAQQDAEFCAKEAETVSASAKLE